ncbi:MAG: aquaporin, partial [Bacteroidota bacterium]
TAVVYSIGDLSGAHINPAVTVAFWAAGVFPFKDILPYIIAQSIGAILASLTLTLLFPEASSLGETLPLNSVTQSFILEILLTYILMFVIINVATGSKEVGMMAGLVIGLTVLLAALFAGPISGASMNPARSLGPALMNGNLTALWIYLTAPFLGAILAVFSWKLLK